MYFEAHPLAETRAKGEEDSAPSSTCARKDDLLNTGGGIFAQSVNSGERAKKGLLVNGATGPDECKATRRPSRSCNAQSSVMERSLGTETMGNRVNGSSRELWEGSRELS
jgi:hypothetical protein